MEASKIDEYGDDVENDEGDASNYLDKMLNQYKQRAQDAPDMQLEDELLFAEADQSHGGGASGNAVNRTGA